MPSLRDRASRFGVLAAIGATFLLSASTVLASSPGADVRLSNDFPGGGYVSADDIAAKKQLGYTPDATDAVAKLKAGDYDAAFFLRPTPVQQVRDIAAAGETMPPKSTYFFPKLLTGIVFNPLSCLLAPVG